MKPEDINEQKPKRALEEKFQLDAQPDSPSPDGLSVVTTSQPHRTDANQKFYETWFNFRGGSLRIESINFSPEVKETVTQFLSALSGHDQTVPVERIVSLYE